MNKKYRLWLIDSRREIDESSMVSGFRNSFDIKQRYFDFETKEGINTENTLQDFLGNKKGLHLTKDGRNIFIPPSSILYMEGYDEESKRNLWVIEN